MKSAFKQNLFLILISLLVGLVLAEIGLRVAGISYPKFHRFDKESGGSLNPNTEGWFTDEGKAYVRINKDGWRDRVHALQKPQDTFRLVVLGDSYVAAMQVEQDKTFWALTERKLQQCTALNGRKLEVLSFGMDGAGTGDELLTYRKQAQRYAPDMVLLAFLTGNDLINNSAKLEADKLRPFFHLKNGHLVEDDSFRESAYFKSRSSGLVNFLAEFLSHSRLMEVARRVYGSMQNGNAEVQAKPVAKRLSRAAAMFDEAGLLKDAYRPPTTPEWKETWEITEALLAQFNSEVKQNGASFYVMTLSNGVQVYPDPVLRREFQQEFGIADLFYPDRRIKEIGDSVGFPVLSLAPIFQVYAERNKVYLHGFKNTKLGIGHWNEFGHRLAGDMLAENLCALLHAKNKVNTH